MMDSCIVLRGRAGSVWLANLRLYLLRIQRTKVMGVCLTGLLGSGGSSSWIALSVQNFSFGSPTGYTVDTDNLALGCMGRQSMMYILFMFVLEFKPQFLNYPLDPHEYARVTHRAKDAGADLAHLQGEIESLQSHPDRDRLAPYVGRLRDRAAVLKQELKQCQQVLDLHLAIDGQAHRERRDRPEVKNRLLEQYKASMMAKRIKRAAEKMQEVEMERRIMEEGGGMQEIGAQSRSQAIVRTQKIELNPQKRLMFGRFEEPTLNMLRFRNSQTEQKGSKVSDSRKSSVGKGVRLPQLGRRPLADDQSHLLVKSSPMKFNKYSVGHENPSLILTNQKAL